MTNRIRRKLGVVMLPEGLIDFIPEFKPLIAEINEVLAKNVEADKVVHGWAYRKI